MFRVGLGLDFFGLFRAGFRIHFFRSCFGFVLGLASLGGFVWASLRAWLLWGLFVLGLGLTSLRFFGLSLGFFLRFVRGWFRVNFFRVSPGLVWGFAAPGFVCPLFRALQRVSCFRVPR